jgi:serine protease Do
LLVEIVVDSVPDDRRLFLGARALAELGPPAPSFKEARRRLARLGAPVASGVSRSFGARVVAALGEAGILARLQASASPRWRRWAFVSSGVGLGLAALALAGLAAIGRGPFARAPEDGPAAPLASAPAVASGASPTKVLEGDAGAALSTQAIGKRAMASVATLSCGETTGTGFFIGEDLLLTNAHVACDSSPRTRGPLEGRPPADRVGSSAPLTVRMSDGRRLMGAVLSRDDWLDLARVKVVGAAAAPLPVGDATALEQGDPLVFIGAPRGLDFTLHEGKVSYVGRNYLGLAYLQINASVNPGNSGGPLLNARGEAVGIVSMKVTDSDGIGLALPLEYALAPAAGPAALRWKQILSGVAERDLEDQEEARLKPRRPQLVATHVLQDEGVVALVLERWDGPPHGTVHTFELQSGGAERCALRASFASWAALEDTARKHPEERRLVWMVRNGVSEGTYVGVGLLEPDGCRPEQLAGEGRLVLREEGEERGRVPINAGALQVTAAKQRDLEQRRAARDEAEHEQRARDEALWRERFRAAREKIAKVERNAQDAQAEISRLDGAARSAQYELTPAGQVRYLQLKEVLERRREEVERAGEELRDLERHAANNAVPLEWRR